MAAAALSRGWILWAGGAGAAAALDQYRRCPMNGPFCLVVNPVAGRGRSQRALSAAAASLDAAGATYQVSESSSLEHAKELAAKAAALGHGVVAVGGDGTAGPLAGVAAGGGAGVGVIPAGDGHDLAPGPRLPLDAPAAPPAPTTG